jgi:hypothetical protein
MVDLSLSCLPSGASTQATDYFSPGIACPSGYYTACHDNNGVSSVTTVTCCPFRGGVTLSCVNPATISDVYSTLFCTWEAFTTTTLAVTLSSDGGTTSTVSTQFTAPGGLNAFGIRMVYESTDLITSSASPTTSTAATTSMTSSTSLPAASTSPASKGSTPASIIAVAVVIPVVVLAVLGAVFLWWRKRSQPREPQGITSELYAKSTEPRGELPGDLTGATSTFPKYVQVPTTPPIELPTEGPR